MVVKVKEKREMLERGQGWEGWEMCVRYLYEMCTICVSGNLSTGL